MRFGPCFALACDRLLSSFRQCVWKMKWGDGRAKKISGGQCSLNLIQKCIKVRYYPSTFFPHFFCVCDARELAALSMSLISSSLNVASHPFFISSQPSSLFRSSISFAGISFEFVKNEFGSLDYIECTDKTYYLIKLSDFQTTKTQNNERKWGQFGASRKRSLKLTK